MYTPISQLVVLFTNDIQIGYEPAGLTMHPPPPK